MVVVAYHQFNHGVKAMEEGKAILEAIVFLLSHFLRGDNGREAQQHVDKLNDIKAGLKPELPKGGDPA
jgi:hypothetical protein